ncbi:DUF3828 domain-containing protein [Brevundimonas sp.]|uniref:DUF3828 domain-containing protein n=1 Tax=Brevundimonas sp. TaxID=1871086 RepID=UPI003D100AE4
MRTILMLTAATLALAACDQPTEKAEAAPATTAATQAATTPEAFIRSLYEDSDDNVEMVEESPMWSARTRALLAETVRLTQEGDQGFFDAQPICDCQDGTPVLQSATATSTGPTTADVVVVQGFAEPGNAVHHKTYKLVLEDGRWKIDDITYQDMGDEFEREPLVQQLNAWIAEARTQPAA